MGVFEIDAGREFGWRCNACGREGDGTVAWPEHERACAAYRAWVARLRREVERLGSSSAKARAS